MAAGVGERALAVAAPAKVNLCLAVGERLPSGYHALLSLVTSVSLEDRVEIEPAPELEVLCDAPGVPVGEANLAYRAAVLLGRATGLEPRLRIRISKRIPVAAGLAGGSADAAAVLAGLNSLWGLGWPPADLARLALRLGADVPFCLMGGSARMEGVGDRLTSLGALPPLHLVLASPRGVQQSTAQAYADLDRTRARPTDLALAGREVDDAIAAWREGDLAGLSARLFNDLEPVAYRSVTELARVAGALRRAGALGVVVSGSGPTLLGIARNRQEADMLAQVAGGAGFWAVPVETRPGGPCALD